MIRIQDSGLALHFTSGASQGFRFKDSGFIRIVPMILQEEEPLKPEAYGLTRHYGIQIYAVVGLIRAVNLFGGEFDRVPPIAWIKKRRGTGDGGRMTGLIARS